VSQRFFLDAAALCKKTAFLMCQMTLRSFINQRFKASSGLASANSGKLQPNKLDHLDNGPFCCGPA
jgi:hypothetical protein